MIRVIEHGPKVIKTRCPHCGCVFEYELEDVKTDGIFSTIQYNSTGQYVECPDCKYHVFHDYFKLDEEPKQPKIWYSTEPIPCFKPGIYLTTDLESHSVCQSTGGKLPEGTVVTNINKEYNPCEYCIDDTGNPTLDCGACLHNKK